MPTPLFVGMLRCRGLVHMVLQDRVRVWRVALGWCAGPAFGEPSVPALCVGGGGLWLGRMLRTDTLFRSTGCASFYRPHEVDGRCDAKIRAPSSSTITPLAGEMPRSPTPSCSPHHPLPLNHASLDRHSVHPLPIFRTGSNLQDRTNSSHNTIPSI